MNDILTVAQSTFERFARIKALYVILTICVLDVAAMGLYRELSLELDPQLMADCALAIITGVGLLTAMVAAFEVPRELREKTAQFILTKPMGRSAFIWGKFVGIGGLALFNITLVTGGSLLVYYLKYDAFRLDILLGAVLIVGEALALTGAGLVLSLVLSDTLAAFGVFVVFAVGHAAYMLPRINESLSVVYYALPSFWNTDIKSEIGGAIPIPNEFILWGFVYALCYGLALTGLATIVFSRKDIA